MKTGLLAPYLSYLSARVASDVFALLLGDLGHGFYSWEVVTDLEILMLVVEMQNQDAVSGPNSAKFVVFVEKPEVLGGVTEVVSGCHETVGESPVVGLSDVLKDYLENQ